MKLEAAIDGIEQNQLGRRNLTPDQFQLLLGRRYNRIKKQGERKDLTSGQTDHKSAAEFIGEQHGVSEKTVRRAAKTAEFVDSLPKPIQADVIAGKTRIIEAKREVKEQERQQKRKANEKKIAKAVKTALAKPTKIDEVKDIRDKAEALRAYKKQAGETLEMQNNCAEIKIRAEVRMGEILLEMPKDRGGGDTRPNHRLHRATSAPTLKQLGIEKTEAHRVQVMAKMPPKKLESIIAETKAAGEELTRQAEKRRLHDATT